MQATVLTCSALAQHQREVRTIGRRRRIRALAPKTSCPHIAYLNGRVILRAEWRRKLADGDTLMFVVLPLGGGNGGSNPMQAVLMIALAVAAPQLAGAMLGTESAAIGLSAIGMSSQTFVSIASSVISLAGNSLISSAFAGRPTNPSPQQAAAMAAPSPTYSLQAQGNVARLESPIPDQYGRMLAYPDFAAQPYSEYAGNELYLYMLLCLGQGHYDIEAIRIEDTPIANFEEIQTEIIGPGGTLTLFPAAVITSSEVAGQTLEGIDSGTYNQVGTTITVTRTGHGLTAGTKLYCDFTSGTAADGDYTVATVVDADHYTLTGASATTSGNLTWQRIVGGFVANGAGSTANALAVDILAPRGVFYANDAGGLDPISISFIVEVRALDSGGTPISAWSILGNETITAGTNTPQRISYRYTVGGGRYEVRLRRTTAVGGTTRHADELVWGALRAYLPETRAFGNVTLIAVKARATSNLSNTSSRKINVISTRRLPIYVAGSGWTDPQPTRNPAWALANICRASYGGAMQDAEINLADLLSLAATCTTRGDNFDARFDSAITLGEALTLTGRAVRTKWFRQGGVISFARDQAMSVPVAMFTMRNIVKGSFGVDYLMPTTDTADSISAGYFDSSVWAPRRVPCTLPGGSTAKPLKADMFGVTNRDHAAREGTYLAAVNRYRRKKIRWATEMEGFIPRFGDLVIVSHDMPAWGQSGEVVAVEAITDSQAVSGWFLGSSASKVADGTGPDGSSTAQAVTDDNGTSVWEYFYSPDVVVSAGQTHSRTFFIKKDAVSSRFVVCRILFYLAGGGGTTQQADVALRTDTGALLAQNAGGGGFVSGVVTAWDSTWWKVTITATVLYTNNRMQMQFFPAAGVTPFAYVSTATGTATLWAGALTRLTLSEPADFSAGGNHYIGLRKRDGSVSGPWLVTATEDPRKVVVAGLLDFTPYVGGAEERSHFAFGAGEAWRQPVRVTGIKPRGLYQVDLEGVNEDDRVHTADTGITPPAAQYSSLPNLFTRPVVEGLTVRSALGDPETMLVSWRPAAGARYYIVEISADGDVWSRLTETTANNIPAKALYGNATLVRVAAFGASLGPWSYKSYASGSEYFWVGADSALFWSASDTDLFWSN